MCDRSSTQPEIPVWFEERKKWVTGITKRTSVDDMIYALVRHSLSRQVDCKSATYPSLGSYKLTCVVNGQQSVLRGRTKIYKLWKSWKNSKAQVTLCITRIPPSTQESIGNQQHMSLIDRILRRKNKDADDMIDSRTRSLDNQKRGGVQCSIHECIASVVEQDKIILSQNEKLRLLNRGISDAESALEKMGKYDSLKNSPISHLKTVDDLSHLIQDIFHPLDSTQLELLLVNVRRYFSLNDHCNQQYATLCDETTVNRDHLTPYDASLREQVCTSRELTRRQCKEIHDLEVEIRECDNALARKKAEIRQVEQGLMEGTLNQFAKLSTSSTTTPSSSSSLSSPNYMDSSSSQSNDAKTNTATTAAAINIHETDSGVTSMSSFEECNQHQSSTTSSHIETLV